MRNFSITIFYGCLSLPVSASVLEDAAAKMQPGEWAEFSAEGWSSSLITTGVDNILNYSNSGVWDPIKKEIRFVGQGHNEAERMIIFDDATNTWRNAPPPVGSGIGHGYDHNAINSGTGISYYRKYYSTDIYAYQNGVWSKLSSMPGTADEYTCCGALVYDNDYGGLTFWSGDKLFGFRDNVWTTLKTGLAVGDYHNVAEYSRQYGLVFGGGGNGNKNLYAMDSKGGTTQIPEAPTGLGVNSGLMFVDPSTGELLVIGSSGSFHAYYPPTKTWLNLKTPSPKFLESENPATKMTVAIPIDSYGVIMLLHRGGAAIYKHSPSGPVSVKPDMGRRQRTIRAGGIVALDFHRNWNPAWGGIELENLLGRKSRALRSGEGIRSFRKVPPAGVYLVPHRN